MKHIASLIVAALAAVASVAPAYAGYHCYTINGQYICCTTYGNQTYCN